MEQIRKYRPEDREHLESLVYGELGLGKGEMTFLTEKCDELIVCESSDELLGFSFFRPLENYDKTGNAYTYIAESKRNQGYGSKLHTEIVRIATDAGTEHFIARTVSSSEIEQNFYKKRDYQNWYILVDMEHSAESVKDLGGNMVPYCDEHFEAYAKGEREAFYEMRKHHNFIPHYACEIDEKTKKEFHDDLIGNTYVMLENNDFLGAVTVTENGIIDDLFVAVEHQGKGVGRKLIHFAINKACENGATSIHLDAVKWNIRAVNLYHSVGFHITHTKYFYMKDKE